MKKITIVATLCTLLFATLAKADSFIQFALWPPIQMIDEDQDISGIRLGFYGRNKNVSGLDFGVAHESTVDFGGVAIGLVSLAGQDASGLIWCAWTDAKRDVYGWQSGIYTHAGGDLTGFQSGLISITDHDLGGGQAAVFSLSRGYMSGIQLGLWNQAGSVEGLQIGLINIAEKMYGLQIGLWNQINEKQDWQHVLPLVNWNF